MNLILKTILCGLQTAKQHGDMRWVDQFVVHIKLFRVSNSYTRSNSMYFLINICATWGNAKR
jgi:hypothetical protein